MNFLQNLRLMGLNEDQGQQQPPQANQTPELSPDELRRRRLERLNAAPSSSLPPQPAPIAAATTLPQLPPPSSVTPPTTITLEPSQKKERKIKDSTDEALVFLLRVSLSPTSLPDVHFLGSLSLELSASALSKDNVESVLYARISAEPNDLVPRPVDSPVRYLFGCVERVAETQRRFPSAEEPIALCSKLLVSYLTTTLAEPGISPQCALARTASGPAPSVYHEVLDLLSHDRTRAKAFMVFEAVANESAANQVAGQIVPPLLDILSQRAKTSPLEPTELLLQTLTQFKPWACEIGAMLSFETLNVRWDEVNWGAGGQGIAAMLNLGMKRRGARFESETKLGPLFAAIASSPAALPTDARARAEVMVTTRISLSARRAALGEAFLNLCKAGPATREQVMAWLVLALELNADRQKSQPPPGTVSSHGFALSLAAVFLRLTWPVLEKADPKHLASLVQDEASLLLSSPAFKGERLLLTTDAEPRPAPPKAPKFVPHVFGLCLRAMALGPIAVLEQMQMIHRQMGYLRGHDGEGSDEFVKLDALLHTMICETLEPDLFAKGMAFYSLASKWLMCAQLEIDPAVASEWWLVPGLPLTAGELNPKLKGVPEHLFADLTKFATAPMTFDRRVVDEAPLAHWEALLCFFIMSMNSPAFAPNTPIRADMGDAIFECFLVESAKWDDQGPVLGRSKPREQLLGSNPLSCARMVPVLMQLYGDVESCSLYDRFHHRHCIARVLRHLWSLDSHRPSFRTFAKTSVDGDDSCDFVKFAHGILNQTNSFVADSMSKLREIRKIQLERRNPETWEALPQAERDLKVQMLEEDEKHVAYSLKVANEVLIMLNYLLTDAEFVRAFTVRSLRGRLVDLFASIVDTLAGTKGREFKIDQPEKYNFKPKEMLSQVVLTLLSCTETKEVADALGVSGYYNEAVFAKAGQLVLQWGMITQQQADLFLKFNARCGQAQRDAKAAELDLGEAPEEFLDPITSEVMNDPVLLPSSRNVVDRDVIVRHLLNEKNDPFNRSPLDVSMLVPQVELKERIYKWRLEKTGKVDGGN